MLSAKWMEELVEKIGEPYVQTDVDDRHIYRYNSYPGEYLPQTIVFVTNTEAVSQVLKIANKYKVPVTPRGQGTGLSGGDLPVHGGILLDMSQWPASIEVFPDDLVARVSPGTMTSTIHAEVEKYGLMYPPDPSSSGISTIGGNLAENAGGPRGLKYGVTKDYVLGLEVVTPEGEVMQTGGRTIKNVTGLNVTNLIVGSEGILGVITRATLKLIPKPLSTQTVMAAFNAMETAGQAISKTLTSGILPGKMEFIDQACAQAVEDYEPNGLLPTDKEAIIIIELDGHPKAVREEANDVSQIMRELGATTISIPETKEEASRIWEARRMVSPAITKMKPSKASEDATVPRSQIPAMMARLADIREKYNLTLVVFGHAGDGNLHPNILCDDTDKEEREMVERAIEEIFRTAIELGGTLSGEHGIGTMKSPFIEDELGSLAVSMMKRLKKSWDPNNIMNPGKVFPDKGQRLILSRQIEK
ncbi:glycolate oxidase [Geomicrobium halophilum]|uniref:Glycolate oxidase n=1 Tax=Geomicrobium halophilum TaxID=549000 RepID=A0A841PQD5_9BACL|nr:FAD-linked oxidase C-terminal domain-containing protein [Geomicrobium halophilum]MBB6450034.1 glycolate oxidase [Geomicrobium halophilum]